MSRHAQTLPGQLGFDALLAQTDTANEARIRDRQYGHLPATIEDALPFFRALLAQHHTAMVAGDTNAVAQLRKEAHHLATKLNNYEPGIIADDDSSGSVLERLTRAKDGQVPLWGQTGSFEIKHEKMRVRIEMEGLFGIGATFVSWLGFSAHTVDKSKPFLSETGYRSFLGSGGALRTGYTPDAFVQAVIADYVDRSLRGRLLKIVPLCMTARGR